MYIKTNKKYGYLLDNINGYPLDKYQRKVVYNESQNTIVIAGAGTGKTTTIIGKIKYLLNVKNYKSEDILCISFTNESVNSLIVNLNKNNIYNVKVETFHKLALEILDNKYEIIESDYLEYIVNELLTEYSDKEKKLIITIINLYKTQDLSPNIFYKIPKKYYYLTYSILKIMIIYENEKKSQNKIDFDDMIIYAKDYVNNNKYKYIIIDEYQDSSLIRVQLIQKLTSINNANLLVVGDDWQSIYRFTGCNLKMFLDFNKYFKKSKKLKLVNTYRNSQQLLNIASKFILKNPYQCKKILKSPISKDKPIKIIYYSKNKNKALIKALNIINNDNILILGRNNFDIKQYLSNELIYENNEIIYNNKKAKYLTIHKSKGLESNEVIILNLENTTYGLPSNIKEEKILKYFQIHSNYFPNDEERRLFYVAITRTKNNVYLLVNKNNPSIFIKELLKDNKKQIEFIS